MKRAKEIGEYGAVTPDEERFLRSKGFTAKKPSVWVKWDRSRYGTFTVDLIKWKSGRWGVEVGQEVDGDWMGGPAPVPMASSVQQAVSSGLTGIKNLRRNWGGEGLARRRQEQVSPKFKRALESELRRLMEAAGTEPMTPDERRDAYSDLRVTLNGKPAEIQGFRNRFGTVWARGVGSFDWSWEAIERVVKNKGGKFTAEF